jgi:hypothetical protein
MDNPCYVSSATREETMKQLVFVSTLIAAVLFAGILMWKAEATPLSGSVAPLAVSQSQALVLDAACKFGTTRCAAGTKWTCVNGSNANGDTKRCWCRHC